MIRASSDVDPGRWYVFDRTKKTLVEVIIDRPALKNTKLSTQKSFTLSGCGRHTDPGVYHAASGCHRRQEPARHRHAARRTGYRDEWGFDWLVQFYAQRGFVVLQPNFRGSEGYGDDWYMKDGFQSWKTSIGDVCDAGRWLVKQGIADPSKLAIVGWSYGGYAALQANVLDPDLYKAVVAIAPVTDLELVKSQATRYTNSEQVKAFIGSGPHVIEGSPAQNAKAFKAAVLMFQGDKDLNVDIAHSKKMDKELRSAHKSSQLIIYPKLDHQLRDSAARTDMLLKSDAFLRTQLKL